MVQYMEIHQFNPLHKQNQRKKTHDHFIRCWEIIWQIQHPFFLKVLEISWIQGPYLDIVKAIYSKSVANIKLNEEKLEAIPLKFRMRQSSPLFPYRFNRVLEVLARAIRPKKWGQRDTNWKGRSQNITICRWYDSMLKWPQKLDQRTPIVEKQLQQSGQI